MVPRIGSPCCRYGESPGLVRVQSLSNSSKSMLWPESSTAELLPKVPVSREPFWPLLLAAERSTISLSPLRFARTLMVRAWSAGWPLGQRAVTFWSGPVLWSMGSAFARSPVGCQWPVVFAEEDAGGVGASALDGLEALGEVDGLEPLEALFPPLGVV